MSTIASQITGVSSVYLAVYSGADQRRHQRSTSLAFVRGIHRWPVNSPHKCPVTRKMFPFDDVIMNNDTLRIQLSISETRFIFSTYIHVAISSVLLYTNIHVAISSAFFNSSFALVFYMQIMLQQSYRSYVWFNYGLINASKNSDIDIGF